MLYPDIDYINDMYNLIIRLSHYIRHSYNKIDEDSLEEMISLTIDLLKTLELYKNDKYEPDYY